jgi:SPP1 family predicted phage head-tail adaptor
MVSMSTKELAAIREAIADTLPDLCNLLTPTYTSDGMGGFTQSFAAVLTNVPCRLDVIKPREQLSADRNVHFATFMLSLPYTTVVSANYRIEVNGGTYNVTGIAPDKSWNAVKRVTVERIA